MCLRSISELSGMMRQRSIRSQHPLIARGSATTVPRHMIYYKLKGYIGNKIYFYLKAACQGVVHCTEPSNLQLLQGFPSRHSRVEPVCPAFTLQLDPQLNPKFGPTLDSDSSQRLDQSATENQ